MLKYLKEQFRQATISPYQRKIEGDLKSRYPEAESVMAALNHPHMEIKTKKYSTFAYGDEETGITLVTQDDASLADDADRFYGALLHRMDVKGLADDGLKNRQQEIYERLYTDYNGNRTRFTLSSLDAALPDENQAILKDSISFLDKANLPACSYILQLLKDDQIIINVGPGRGLSGGFSPDSKELSLYYNPGASHADAVAATTHTLLHEACHYYQQKEGLLAECAHEVDNYREIYHLNELQAHTAQFTVALKTLSQRPCFEQFLSGALTIEELTQELNNTEDIEAQLCRRALCKTESGHIILENLQTRQQAEADYGVFSFDPETITKEALCHGRITAMNGDIPEYNREQFSRMQRYAHSHIALMNFDTSGGNDKEETIRRAVKGHFNGPLGLSREGNNVSFADKKIIFTSAVTGRPMAVSDIEFLWQKYGGENTTGLGLKSEEIVQKPSHEAQNYKSKADFSQFRQKT